MYCFSIYDFSGDVLHVEIVAVLFYGSGRCISCARITLNSWLRRKSLPHKKNFFLWHNSPAWAKATSLLEFPEHTQLDTYQVGLLWMSDWLIGEADNYTVFDKHMRWTSSCLQHLLNSWSQQSCSCRPTP